LLDFFDVGAPRDAPGDLHFSRRIVLEERNNPGFRG